MDDKSKQQGQQQPPRQGSQPSNMPDRERTQDEHNREDTGKPLQLDEKGKEKEHKEHQKPGQAGTGHQGGQHQPGQPGGQNR